ncbi:hypothetical protein OV208_27360 [Corallococcus sp. bb12-1]|uniref:hypothetical protein n=1 Tax=Corallococcus sp. bb12-1 TaxID=2996784 RepID=UPI002270CE25|nr:hypothetical protein [Corallococcus sp. bb12-1]MCY1045063.1 hypothetical protein [Corallococcus sp. bb12-1]
MRSLRAMACILALGATLAYTGCSDDDDDNKPDGGSTPDSGTPDAGPTTTEFTAFVRDQIENQTNETGTPVTLDDKNLVDTEPADAFPPAFFQ